MVIKSTRAPKKIKSKKSTLSFAYVLPILLFLSLVINICQYDLFQSIPLADSSQDRKEFVIKSESEAIDALIANSYSIEKWMKKINDAREEDSNIGTAKFIATWDGDHVYSIHAYQDGDQMIQTYGWYYVDALTGVVSESLN